jgi:vacuolar iron transporter family protein
LGELFDLTLYKTLRPVAGPELKKVLDELVPVETRHMDIWRSFFHLPPQTLGWGLKLKLGVLTLAGRIFGDAAIQLIMEGIEVHGIQKYLDVWEGAKGTPLGETVRDILKDEMGHEEDIVLAGSVRRMDPEKIRTFFLGFNDGCVEILGAVSGFMAAFHDVAHVLAASVSVSVAGAISMAAGVFVSSGSEREVAAVEAAKRRFMDPAAPADPPSGSLGASSLRVGIAYIIGSMMPVTPVLLGARGPMATVLSAGAAIVLVSVVLAFLTGMAVRRRVLINVVIIFVAVGISYAVGMLARMFWGISL